MWIKFEAGVTTDMDFHSKLVDFGGYHPKLEMKMATIAKNSDVDLYEGGYIFIPWSYYNGGNLVKAGFITAMSEITLYFGTNPGPVYFDDFCLYRGDGTTTTTTTTTTSTTDTTTDTEPSTRCVGLLGNPSLSGTIGAADLLLIKKHILNISQLTGDPLLLAKITGGANVGAADLLALKKHILNIQLITGNVYA